MAQEALVDHREVLQTVLQLRVVQGQTAVLAERFLSADWLEEMVCPLYLPLLRIPMQQQVSPLLGVMVAQAVLEE